MSALRLLPLLALLTLPPASADIYKYVDEQGNVTFTNTPMKGAKRIAIEPSAAPRAADKAKTGSRAQAATPSPAHFPKVSTGTQKERDVNRRRILEEELSAERRLHEQRKSELAAAESNRSAEEKANPSQYLERIRRLREGLVLHEKNISALQTELGKIR